MNWFADSQGNTFTIRHDDLPIAQALFLWSTADEQEAEDFALRANEIGFDDARFEMFGEDDPLLN